ncbi:MAG: endonuclease NucS [Candidatus Woesearchaeota archaeon]
MELNEFEEEFESALKANNFIVFFCSCAIRYSGRAEAELGRGDRLVMIKGDNTLHIHQPSGGTPINYMKSGADIVLEKSSHHFILKAKHVKSKEFIDMEIFRVYNFMAEKLEDGAKQILVGNERDMSDMIKENPEIISKDFKPLSREEHTTFGFIDVFGHDKNGNLVIVECKRYAAGLDAVTQLRRYVEKIKELKGTDKVTGVIAAPSITPNAMEMLKKWKFLFRDVHPPKRLERFRKDQKTLQGF